MSHQLDFIKKDHIRKALARIDLDGVPTDHQFSEYWIHYNNKLYQFKYVVEVASAFTNKPIETNYFKSNDSSRNYVAALGFQILFNVREKTGSKTAYWIGASYYGGPGNQKDMIRDFMKSKYWRTDHNLTKGEGLKIYGELKKVKINDRIAIRYLDKKGGKIEIDTLGTVKSVDHINDGKLAIIWDYNPPKFKGPKPAGSGSGNWWKTLVQLKNEADIATIFNEIKVEKRISRLSWNLNGWVMPSGPSGKSTNKNTHEGLYGYGHEEWLFDVGKLIDGFHYGFLEPIRKQQEAYTGKVYDVWLYSINGTTKKRFWIGEIKNLIVLTKTEALKAYKDYYNNGWIEEMKNQIRASGANAEGFSNWKGVDLFNVKFKPEDILVNDPYFELPGNHPVNTIGRYSFSHFDKVYEIANEEKDDFKFISSLPGDGDNMGPESAIQIRLPKAIEIKYLHRVISKSLTKFLKDQYGDENVTREHDAGYGANKIDIVVRHKDHLTFYEIKTYNSIRTSIREAIGQLMEYALWTNQNKAKQLIVVTQPLENREHAKIYFRHLRDTYNLPLYYQSFDYKNKILSEIV